MPKKSVLCLASNLAFSEEQIQCNCKQLHKQCNASYFGQFGHSFADCVSSASYNFSRGLEVDYCFLLIIFTSVAW